MTNFWEKDSFIETLNEKIKLMNKPLNDFGIIIIILMFGLSIYLFMVGFHNMDLGQNMRYIECQFDAELEDKTSAGRSLPGEDLYILGFKQLMLGFAFCSINCLSLGYKIRGIKSYQG